MHTLSDKVSFVQRKHKPEEAFTTKKWMVLAEHLLAQAHIWVILLKTGQNCDIEGANPNGEFF